MKNLILKKATLFVFVPFFMVVSAQAQSYLQYEAQIPFDFQIGNKAFEAGNYVVGVKSPYTLDAVFTITNAKNRESRQIFVLRNGSISQTDKTVLMFNRYGEQYILSKIVSQEFGFSVHKPRINRLLSLKTVQQQQAVEIVLVKLEKNTQ